jgi:hypothetical protein
MAHGPGYYANRRERRGRTWPVYAPGFRALSAESLTHDAWTSTMLTHHRRP